MATAFETAWVRPVRFGVLAAVHLPSGLAPVPPKVLERLHPSEASRAHGERGRRQIEVVGGRLAFRAAAHGLGVDVSAVGLGSTPARAPIAPPGLCVSITHKEDLAIAFVGWREAGEVGVDLEGGPRVHLAITSQVCRPEELEELDRLAEEGRLQNVMIRFAVKEALYKAIAPQLGRSFGFQAARVQVVSREHVAITLFLDDAPAYGLESELVWLPDARVVALVRALAP